jgi:PTS system nitrogen regulatory IIA component
MVAVTEILAADRVSVSNPTEGMIRDKREALERLSAMLASGQRVVGVERNLNVFVEREKLQSTGVGGGVAMPHGSIDDLEQQIGALLVCPTPIPFDAIDGRPVNILFALVGPKGSPAQHLKILARVSRVLKQESFRARLVSAPGGREAYALIVDSDGDGR